MKTESDQGKREERGTTKWKRSWLYEIIYTLQDLLFTRQEKGGKRKMENGKW